MSRITYINIRLAQRRNCKKNHEQILEEEQMPRNEAEPFREILVEAQAKNKPLKRRLSSQGRRKRGCQGTNSTRNYLHVQGRPKERPTIISFCHLLSKVICSFLCNQSEDLFCLSHVLMFPLGCLQ
jgi:hypothetical protein